MFLMTHPEQRGFPLYIPEAMGGCPQTYVIVCALIRSYGLWQCSEHPHTAPLL